MRDGGEGRRYVLYYKYLIYTVKYQSESPAQIIFAGINETLESVIFKILFGFSILLKS